MPSDMIAILVAGIVQGITEWLPISSTAATMFTLLNFGVDKVDAYSLSLISHIGTLFAAAFALRKDIGRIIAKGMASGILKFLAISTVLTGIVGAPIYLAVGSMLEYGEGAIAIFMGILLLITALLLVKTKKTGNREQESVGIKDGAVVGILQGFSILPGVSRSGISIFALGIRGFSSESAVRLSFLLSIPTVLAAEIGFMVLAGKVSVLPSFESIALIVAASFVSGAIAINVLLATIGKWEFWKLCLALALAYILWGAISTFI